MCNVKLYIVITWLISNNCMFLIRNCSLQYQIYKFICNALLIKIVAVFCVIGDGHYCYTKIYTIDLFIFCHQPVSDKYIC